MPLGYPDRVELEHDQIADEILVEACSSRSGSAMLSKTLNAL